MSKESPRRFLIVVLAAGLLMTGPAQPEIYKTVDEAGNVVYTDQPPDESAEPMDLPELSVVEAVQAAPRAASQPDPSDEEEVTSVRDLRRGYRDFAIVSPQPEETIWGTGNEVLVAWNTQYRLQPGMKVTFYVDGESRETSTESSITLSRLNRGAHTVYAELWDARNRKIATTQPVTFYIQQYSVNYGANRNSGN